MTVARLDEANLTTALEIIARYPVKRSAVVPLCHLAQEQDGWLTQDAMAHIAELVDCTPAEILGTASFYEMFKLEPVGRYVMNICVGISCLLMGGDDLLHHAEQRLGILPGQTTEDGRFTIDGVECIAACSEAPCMQVNYRYFHRVSHAEFDQIVDDLAAKGRTDVPTKSNDTGDVPPHGTLCLLRQHVPPEERAGNADPGVPVEPAWLAAPNDESSGVT